MCVYDRHTIGFLIWMIFHNILFFKKSQKTDVFFQFLVFANTIHFMIMWYNLSLSLVYNYICFVINIFREIWLLTCKFKKKTAADTNPYFINTYNVYIDSIFFVSFKYRFPSLIFLGLASVRDDALYVRFIPLSV